MYCSNCIPDTQRYPLTMSDIRYSFLGTLDHLPADTIRTLWLIQTLDSKLRDEETPPELFQFYSRNIVHQSAQLGDLVRRQSRVLEEYREELVVQREVKARYSALMRTRADLQQRLLHKHDKPPIVEKKGGLKIKINMKQLRREQVRRGSIAGSSQSSSALSSPPVSAGLGQEQAQPMEEVYCWCQQPSFGDMIACDNDKCPREWFHYACVGITKVPAGKWYCSDECRKADSKKSRKR